MPKTNKLKKKTKLINKQVIFTSFNEVMTKYLSETHFTDSYNSFLLRNEEKEKKQSLDVNISI